MTVNSPTAALLVEVLLVEGAMLDEGIVYDGVSKNKEKCIIKYIEIKSDVHI